MTGTEAAEPPTADPWTDLRQALARISAYLDGTHDPDDWFNWSLRRVEEDVPVLLALFKRATETTEWGAPRTEWTYGTRATDGPGRVIGFECSEQEARAIAAEPPVDPQRWVKVALCREVGPWREVPATAGTPRKD